MKSIARIRILYFLVWGIPLALAALYFLGLFEGEDCLANDSKSSYILSAAAILLTLGIIYFAIKLFRFKFISKQLQTPDKTKQIKVYINWNILRYLLLLAVIIFDLYLYFVTAGTTGFYCAVIALLSASFCFPTIQEIEEPATPPEEPASTPEEQETAKAEQGSETEESGTKPE